MPPNLKNYLRWRVPVSEWGLSEVLQRTLQKLSISSNAYFEYKVTLIWRLHSTITKASTLLRKSEKPISGDKQNTPALDLEKQSQSKKVEPKKEVWAEPKPVQRRIRRRRHSADCRLLSKYAPITGTYINRPPYAANPVSKKSGSSVHPEVRTRHRPPPLVIPSSVNTFAPHPPSHPNFYQSHLHHRRTQNLQSAHQNVEVG